MAATGFVFRIFVLILVLITDAQSKGRRLKRSKEIDWIIPPIFIMENTDYNAPIKKIESSQTAPVHYTLKGKGATEGQFHLFRIDEMTGEIYLNGHLDREEIDGYSMLAQAWFFNGTVAEDSIDVEIEVGDQNDCEPIFSFEASGATGSVFELSAEATLVMTVTATDADKPGTINSQISYTLVEQGSLGSSDMFYMNKATGEIFVKSSSLDRETQGTYSLTVTASDMNGEAGGLTGTGKVVIEIMDVNDNIPTLEKTHYELNVKENAFNVTVLTLKALDRDLIHTDNWLAVFTIVSGNEDGYFTITTNKKTNEGIMVLNKAIDYEELRELDLQISVSNVAKYHPSVITTATETKTYSIKVRVENEQQYRFEPAVKHVSVPEDPARIDLKQIITTYKVIDRESMQYAANVIYRKGTDQDDWITIDSITGEIRLNKLPDRESKYLIKGTYYAEIICYSKADSSGSSQLTATGTIAIDVEDFNDSCPKLTSTTQHVCIHGEEDAVYVTAVDADSSPQNGPPFHFEITKTHNNDQWSVEPLPDNGTTVILRPKHSLFPSTYEISMEIKDRKGKACPDEQVLTLEVCTTRVPGVVPRVKLGVGGILVMLLGFLLLFLLPFLLLFCLCHSGALSPGFKSILWTAQEHLIDYHTEGKGEDKDVPSLVLPIDITDTRPDIVVPGYTIGNGGYISTGSHGGTYISEFEGIALSEEFLREYVSKKLYTVEELQSERETPLVYEYEGRESPAGSVGCCSLLEDDNDLAFLNDLGPKFKTLAEICGGRATVVESSTVTVTSPQPPYHVTQPPSHPLPHGTIGFGTVTVTAPAPPQPPSHPFPHGTIGFESSNVTVIAPAPLQPPSHPLPHGTIGFDSNNVAVIAPALPQPPSHPFPHGTIGFDSSNVAVIAPALPQPPSHPFPHGTIGFGSSNVTVIAPAPPQPPSHPLPHGTIGFESSNVSVTAPAPLQPPVTTHVSSHVDISRDIANSISAARAEASSLATSSSMLQESIISSGRPATTTVHVKENVVVPTQTLLIQQPTLYCAGAPPVYVVDPQPHPTLMVTPAVNLGKNLVMVESQASNQLQGISQGVVGMGSIHGTQGLVLVEGNALAAGQHQQVIGTLGKRQVVTVESQKGTSSGFGTGIGHSATLGLGSASLAETVVSAASGRLHHEASGGLIQVIPSQANASQSVELRGQSASSFGVMPETVLDGTRNVVVQEKVSVTERTMQSSSLA